MADRFLDLPGLFGHDASTPHINLLDADTAHIQQGTGQWTVGGGNNSENLGQSTDVTRIFGDVHAVADPIGTPASCAVSTPSGLSGFPVSPTTQYVFVVSVASDQADMESFLQIGWSDAAGVFNSTSTQAATLLAAASTFETRSLTATSPGAAAFASLAILWQPAAGLLADADLLYWDAACLRTGAVVSFVPSHRIVGDIDMRASILPVLYAPTADQHLVAKRSGTAGYGIRLDATADSVSVRHGDGVTDRDTALAMSFTAGTRAEIRATFDMATGVWNGYLGNVLADTDSGFTTAVAVPSTEALYAGSEGGAGPFQGDIDWVEVRDGVSGPVVARFDAHDFTVGDSNGSTATDVEGNTWTINGAASSIVAVSVPVAATVETRGPTGFMQTIG